MQPRRIPLFKLCYNFSHYLLVSTKSMDGYHREILLTPTFFSIRDMATDIIVAYHHEDPQYKQMYLFDATILLEKIRFNTRLMRELKIFRPKQSAIVAHFEVTISRQLTNWKKSINGNGWKKPDKTQSKSPRTRGLEAPSKVTLEELVEAIDRLHNLTPEDILTFLHSQKDPAWRERLMYSPLYWKLEERFDTESFEKHERARLAKKEQMRLLRQEKATQEAENEIKTNEKEGASDRLAPVTPFLQDIAESPKGSKSPSLDLLKGPKSSLFSVSESLLKKMEQEEKQRLENMEKRTND